MMRIAVLRNCEKGVIMTYIFAKGKLTKINHRKHNDKNSENLKIYYIHIYTSHKSEFISTKK